MITRSKSQRQFYTKNLFASSKGTKSAEYVSAPTHGSRKVFDIVFETGAPINLMSLGVVLRRVENITDADIANNLEQNDGAALHSGICDTWTLARYHSNGKVEFVGTSRKDYDEVVEYVVQVLNEAHNVAAGNDVSS